ncbi:hypothetical protein BKI52_17570 [marine bacterium AO1-C]|nr:hypothetical protein BKI52_17570 [marine bacterium AO1-C]
MSNDQNLNKGNNKEETNQNHQGSGDNIGKDKFEIHNTTHHHHYPDSPKTSKKKLIISKKIKPYVVVAIALALFSVSFAAYRVLFSACKSQGKQLQVDIAHFTPNKSQGFAIRLTKVINTKLSPSYSHLVNTDIYDKYLLQNANAKQRKIEVAKVVNRFCDYKGIVVYGLRDQAGKSLDCWIDIQNLKRSAEHQLSEPPSPIKFNIPEHATYVSDFILGIIKLYLGKKDAALESFRVFATEIEKEKSKTRKGKK